MKDSETVHQNSSFMESPPRLAAGILAGGKSRRMKKDKLSLLLQGQTILDRIISELRIFPELLLSIPENDIPRFSRYGLTVIPDQCSGKGPIEGIRRLLGAASSEYLFVCAGDMPFIKSDLAVYLSGYISSDYDCFVMTADGRSEPLCAIYSKKVLKDIERQIASGNYRLKDLLDTLRVKYVPIEMSCFDKTALVNINTPEEYASCLKPHIFCICGFKHSGKTTLIEKLIPFFIRDGHSVSVIKHDGHDSISEDPGTDTARSTAAGAISAAVYSDSGFLMNFRQKTGIDTLIRYTVDTAKPDFIIIEGLKSCGYPKIPVLQEYKDSPDKFQKPWICAAAGSILPVLDSPVFDIDDAAGIYRSVIDYFTS